MKKETKEHEGVKQEFVRMGICSETKEYIDLKFCDTCTIKEEAICYLYSIKRLRNKKHNIDILTNIMEKHKGRLEKKWKR